MLMRLRALPLGWMIIALAYGIGVMPIDFTIHILWAGLATGAAYLVLAARTTHATAQLAQEASQSPLRVWRTAMQSTLINPLLLALPLFTLVQATQKYLMTTPYYTCPTITRAYCFTMGGTLPQWEAVLLAMSVLATFLLLDHLLLVSLTLLAHKHLAKSPIFVGNAAIGLRAGLACVVVGVVAVVLGFYQPFSYDANNEAQLTNRRVVETIYPAFEPLVSDGVFLVANILNRPSYCIQWDPNTSNTCVRMNETRPFIARQLVVMILGASLYLIAIIGVLRMVTPFMGDTRKKAKRGLVEPETDIVHI